MAKQTSTNKLKIVLIYSDTRQPPHHEIKLVHPVSCFSIHVNFVLALDKKKNYLSVSNTFMFGVEVF